ncbi:MAG: diguanylate cyclase [Nitriliruptoraceae bacterium]
MPRSHPRPILPWPVLVVLTVGALAAVVAFLVLQNRITVQAEQLSDARAEVVAQEVRAELERHRDLAALAAAWLETNPDPAREAFDAYLLRTGLADRYPALASVVAVTPVDAGVSEGGAAAAPDPDAVLAPAPATGRAAGYVVTAGRAADGRSVPVGLDLMDSPEAIAALEVARESGEPTLTDPYRFLSDRDLSGRDRQHGLLLAAPVYGRADRGPTSLRAWTVVAFRGEALLSSVLGSVGRGFDVAVTDEQVTGAEDSRGIGVLADGGRLEPPTAPIEPVAERTVEVAGQRWVVEVAPRVEALAGIETTKPWIAALQLAAMTVAIALLVARLTTARDRAVATVGQATAELEVANADLRAREEHGRRTTATLAAVVEVQRELAAVASDPDALLDEVAVHGQRLTGATGAVVELPEEDELVYRHASGSVTPHLGLRLPIGGSLSGRCIATGEVLRSDDVQTDDRVDATACQRVGLRSMVLTPLLHEGTVAGVLKVVSTAPRAFDEDSEWALTLLAGTVEAALGASRRFEARAMHDGLTGLATRGLFQARLRTACARSQRSGTHVAVLFVDLDGFKAVNDTYGHAAGDQLLQIAAQRLVGAVRPADTVARFGGDEFAVVCVVDDPAEPARIQRRVQDSLDGDPVSLSGLRLPLRASVGLASSGPGPVDCSDLLARADADMYRVKHRRRPGPDPDCSGEVIVRL